MLLPLSTVERGLGGEVNMPALERPLRALLENTVKRAREVAEKAAISALAQIGVSQASPDAFLTAEQKELRNKLRAHGRSLGDVRAESGTQTCDILQEEVAYQFWHRMIFARFLAENNLLMVDVGGTYVPVTLDDCNELAESEGAENGWELAARYAARMLPQIFPVDSPIFGLRLSPEALHELESLLSALPAEVFTATDSLGWIYQYWQSKRKDDINKSEVKIGARELPAVTQLFTEPYMVQFLLDNHLGALWANQRLTPEDGQNTQSEDELRQKAAIDGVPLTYLRFTPLHSGEGCQGGEGLKHFTLLDPCCGSGHFLVAALHYLVPMRMALEHLSARDAVDAVLRDNIHGLELDDRCVKIAAFALALAAWTYPDAGGYRELPRLNIACSGRSPAASRDEWRALGKSKNMQLLYGWLYDAFQKAPTLGSLIDPQKFEAAKLVDWNAFTTALDEALARETDDNAHEMAISARGLAFAARLLTQKYDAIYTNVPYLSAGKQDEVLRKFCAEKYPDAKGDIANVFLERCLELCKPGGTANVVMPQNWLFLKSYKKEREKLLKNYTFNILARLGEKGFDSSAAAGAFVILLSITNHRPVGADGLFNHLTPPAPLPTVGRGEDNLPTQYPLQCGERENKYRTTVLRNYKVDEVKLELAKSFRKEPTIFESMVWEWVRNRKMFNLKWRRQQVIEGFIADFYCADKDLVIEVDGSVHDSKEAKEYDRIRDEVFMRMGITTLRISNSNCTEDNVRKLISDYLSQDSSSSKQKSPVKCTPFPLPTVGRGEGEPAARLAGGGGGGG